MSRTHAELETLRKAACTQLANVIAFIKINKEERAKAHYDELKSILNQMFD